MSIGDIKSDGIFSWAYPRLVFIKNKVNKAISDVGFGISELKLFLKIR
jgi:hypothetical protein